MTEYTSDCTPSKFRKLKLIFSISYFSGLEEDMTMIRTIGNMYSTHNVQFRLAHLVNEYYRSGDHRNKSSDYKGGRPHSAPSSGQEKDGKLLKGLDTFFFTE